MNKNGFTLIELLAVISIIAIISMIAVPNIMDTLDGIKKDNFLADAKKLIANAKYEVSKNDEIRNSGNRTFLFDELNQSGEISSDPDGGSYNKASYVKYDIDNDEATYCISLIGSKKNIGRNNCVKEKDLTSRGVVVNN